MVNNFFYGPEIVCFSNALLMHTACMHTKPVHHAAMLHLQLQISARNIVYRNSRHVLRVSNALQVAKKHAVWLNASRNIFYCEVFSVRPRPGRLWRASKPNKRSLAFSQLASAAECFVWVRYIEVVLLINADFCNAKWKIWNAKWMK